MASELITVTRWRRFGHDRLYVAGAGGAQLGYRDLATGQDHAAAPEHQEALGAAADAWVADRSDTGGRTATSPSPLPTPAPAPPVAETERPWVDLSLNRPGAAVREIARAERASAPVRTTVDRVLGRHNDERAWRKGADGEELVARQLARASRSDPAWRAIHAIRVGRRGADIDHLVIGPGGVFTVNAKCHPDKDIWVGGNTFLVGGHPTPYVRNSRHEARRAARLLSEALGEPVHVEGLVVPVLSSRPVIKSQPGDGVWVVPRRQLSAWLLSLGPVIPVDRLSRLWEAARRSTTWAS